MTLAASIIPTMTFRTWAIGNARGTGPDLIAIAKREPWRILGIPQEPVLANAVKPKRQLFMKYHPDHYEPPDLHPAELIDPNDDPRSWPAKIAETAVSAFEEYCKAPDAFESSPEATTFTAPEMDSAEVYDWLWTLPLVSRLEALRTVAPQLSDLSYGPGILNAFDGDANRHAALGILLDTGIPIDSELVYLVLPRFESQKSALSALKRMAPQLAEMEYGPGILEAFTNDSSKLEALRVLLETHAEVESKWAHLVMRRFDFEGTAETALRRIALQMTDLDYGPGIVDCFARDESRASAVRILLETGLPVSPNWADLVLEQFQSRTYFDEAWNLISARLKE